MLLSLNLGPDLEQRLSELAAERGLTVEGYLLTLIEALANPVPRRPKRLHAVLHGLLRKPKPPEEPDATVEAALRQSKAELLLHKERAIAAVTKANLLRKTAERLQAAIAAKELEALTRVRDGNERALASFQESCVLGENLQFTKAKLDAACAEAEELLHAFKLEERKFQGRLSPTQSVALDAIASEYTAVVIPADEMELRIVALGSSEEWQDRFTLWIARTTEQPEAPDIPSDLEFI